MRHPRQERKAGVKSSPSVPPTSWRPHHSLPQSPSCDLPPADPRTLRGVCPSERGRRPWDAAPRPPPQDSSREQSPAPAGPFLSLVQRPRSCALAVPGPGPCLRSRVTLVFVLSCQELQNALQQRLLLRPAGVLLAAEEEGVQQHRQRRGPGDPQVWRPPGGRRAGGQAPGHRGWNGLGSRDSSLPPGSVCSAWAPGRTPTSAPLLARWTHGWKSWVGSGSCLWARATSCAAKRRPSAAGPRPPSR